MENEEEKKPRRWQRTARAVVCIVLTVVLAGLTVALTYVCNRLSLVGRIPDGTEPPLSSEQVEEILAQTDAYEQAPPAEPVDPDRIVWSTLPCVQELRAEGSVINLLLIGQDRRPGETRARSDAIILLTVNTKSRTVTLTSFMRDLYVPIPGYPDNRINASYALGGAALLDSCLQTNFGVNVDGNVEVDFEGFRGVIDLAGGVDMALSAEEAAYLNNLSPSLDPDGAPWALQTGQNHLNGIQALAYTRIRAVGRDDFQRTQRQRAVLSALLERCRGMSILQLDQLLREMLPLLTTDLSTPEILGYAMEIFPVLTDVHVSTQQVPADGAYREANVRGMCVLIPDLEKIRAQLSQTLEDPNVP